MITINGTLLVKTVQGRRGDFAVGTLFTEIGEFKVKDTILDQFSEGEYRGQFAIARIYQGSYAWKGAMISELRANITDIELDEAAEKAVPPAESPSFADPIEESRVAPSAPAAPTDEEAVDAQSAIPSSADTTTDDVESAITASLPVKLDPTIDRALFRMQRDRLKTAGYRFDAATQTWLAAATTE